MPSRMGVQGSFPLRDRQVAPLRRIRDAQAPVTLIITTGSGQPCVPGLPPPPFAPRRGGPLGVSEQVHPVVCPGFLFEMPRIDIPGVQVGDDRQQGIHTVRSLAADDEQDQQDDDDNHEDSTQADVHIRLPSLRCAGTASGHSRRRRRHIRCDRTRIIITITHIRSRISTRRRSDSEVAADGVTVIRRALTVNRRGNAFVSHHLPFPLPAAGGVFGGFLNGGFAPGNGGFHPFAFASSAADCGGFFFPATVSRLP
jgi:hypothetical protein